MAETTRWTRLGVPSVRRTRLVLAVSVIDAVTGRHPSTAVDVSLQGVDVDSVRTQRGEYLFLDTGRGPSIPTGELTLVVDGGERYQTVHEPVIPSDDTSIEVTLVPTTAYSFPPSATTIRGRLLDASADPIPDATVTISDLGPPTETDVDGEFALFFADLTGDDVAVGTDGERRVVIDGGDPELDVTVGQRTDTVPVRVLEGRTTKVRLRATASDLVVIDLTHE